MDIPQVDLEILKALVSNYNISLNFASGCSPEIISEDAQQFVKSITSYVKTYKALPTKKVLLDIDAKYSDRVEYIEEIWDQLDQTDYDEKEYSYNLDKLKKRHKEKLIFDMGQSIENQMGEDGLEDPDRAAKLIEQTIQKIRGLDNNQTFTQRTLKDDVSVFRAEYNAKKLDPDLGRGILTRYSAIDFATDGLKSAELLIIGAESSGGKSFLLSNLAVQMWMQDNQLYTNPKDYTKGHNVLYFTLEMPYDRCRARLLAKMADVPSKNILNGTLTREQEDRVEMALEFIEKYPYQFEMVDIARGTTTAQIEARFEEAKLRFNPEVVVIDYLGLMEDEDMGADAPDWLKLGYIAGKVHEFTRFHNVVGMTAVQLTTPDPGKKKDNYNPEENVGLHRIGRSKFIMHHANIGIQLITRRDEKKYSTLLYQFIKNRDGENGIKGTLTKNLANGALLDTSFNHDGASNDSGEDITQGVKAPPPMAPPSKIIKPAVQQSSIPQSIIDAQEDLEEEYDEES
jgi:hypothetical protein